MSCSKSSGKRGLFLFPETNAPCLKQSFTFTFSTNPFLLKQAQKLYQLIYIFTNGTAYEYIKKEFYQTGKRKDVCKSKIFTLY